VRIGLAFHNFSQDLFTFLFLPRSRTCTHVNLQAAKEFESELKKEPDSTSDTPGEQPTTISEEKKHDIEVSSSKESV